MIRRYGPAPYRVLFLHGGPGAAGSVGGACLELGKICGVLEPWQSKYSVAELTEELDGQIRDFATAPVTLIGHSWGAWLSLLYAATHPQTVSQLVWIGCPPLDESYAPLINARRMQNLTVQEAKHFAKALEILEKGPEEQKAQALKTLDALACRADTTEPLEENAHPEVNDLVGRYFTALQEGDEETLTSLRDNTGTADLLRMQENSSHIEAYTDISCYTKSGLEADSYVVFACYEVKFQGIDDISEVEAWRGAELYVERKDAVPLGENEYYIADLLGMEVLLERGERLGILKDVLSTGANDVYIVESEKYGEVLIPAIKQCIMGVDVVSGVMTVRLLPGLINENGREKA